MNWLCAVEAERNSNVNGDLIIKLTGSDLFGICSFFIFSVFQYIFLV